MAILRVLMGLIGTHIPEIIRPYLIAHGTAAANSVIGHCLVGQLVVLPLSLRPRCQSIISFFSFMTLQPTLLRCVPYVAPGAKVIRLDHRHNSTSEASRSLFETLESFDEVRGLLSASLLRFGSQFFPARPLNPTHLDRPSSPRLQCRETVLGLILTLF